MRKFNLFLIVALIASLTISCGDDVDATKPDVTIQTPSESDEYAVGETIYFTATFSDNKGLKSCLVSISLVQGVGDGNPWTPSSMSIPLSGTSQSVDNITLFGEPIPPRQSGTYKIKFEVSDNADVPNVTVKEVNIEIISTTPTLEVIKPAEGSKYKEGEEFLLLSATCTDNKELKELVYKVDFMDYGKNILKGATGVNDPWEPGEAKFEFTGNSKTFTDTILYGEQIPISKHGNYKLTLTLFDADGNSTVKEINFVLE